jgi:general stress protein CsbA
VYRVSISTRAVPVIVRARYVATALTQVLVAIADHLTESNR